MEDFNKDFIAEENSVESESVLESNQEPFEDDAETSKDDTIFSTDNDEVSDNESLCNPINYSDVEAIEDYTPMNKGLKIFAIIMAALIALSASCVAGYFFGKNSNNLSNSKDIEMSLAAKPKETDEYTPAQIYDKVNESIVGIYVYNTEGKASQASGVVYSDDGYIITNDHIYSEISAPKFKVYTSDGKEYNASYVAGDKISDLAVLKVKDGKLTPAVFGNSKELIYGERVVAIGRPNDATDDSSITSGIISAVSRRVQTTTSYSASLIQTDSAINPGSSGGALVNMYGQVVGITSSKLAGVEYDAIGYAIPTLTVKRIAEELISEGKVVSRAKLGISYTAINSVTAEINGLDYTGLSVASVTEDSDLFGKLNVGDVITHVNDIEITNDTVILDVIENSKAGDRIKITVVNKNGKATDYDVVLRANIGESSYTTEKIEENPSDNNSGGGTFDFPFGE